MVIEDMNQSNKRSSDDVEGNRSSYKRKRLDGSEFNLRILLASKNAGAIIGKRGDNIKSLRTGFNGHILIIDSNGPEKVLSISSEISNVCEALLKIIPCFEDYQTNEDLEFECEIRMLIHQSQAGCIIGHQGSRIKELRENTGAGIKLFTECCPMSTERVVEIKAKPTIVVDCVKTIYDYLQKAPPLGPNVPYDPFNYDEYSVGDYGGYNMTEGVSTKTGCKGGRFSRGRGSNTDRGRNYGMNRGMYDQDYGMNSSNRMGPRDFGMNSGRRNNYGGYDEYDMHNRNDRFSSGRDNSFENFSRTRGPQDWSGSNEYDPYDDFSSTRYGNEKSVSTQVTIPQEMAGSIIGSKGSNIRQINMKTGADIFIAEPEEGSSERIITIKGTEKQIKAAEYLMQISVKNKAQY